MRTLFIIATLMSFSANAQTVIDYANFTGNGCVFASSTDVPATINGTSGNVKHQTSVGEVDYGSTTHVLYFQSNSTNSVGSEFKIEYTFRPSYSYSIVVNTRSINNSGATPWLRLTITNSASSSAICSGPQSINGTIFRDFDL